ncbi:MAG: tRNA lysidine(34) synthetase TilS [Bacteroidota bacterium]
MRDIFNSFKQYIKAQGLFHPADRILLAVSGGVDSVVMCELFHRAEYDFGIAHCNFQLRGKESEEDEKFVNKLSEKYGKPFFVKRFDTKNSAKKNGISIQMAARELRYEWFEKVRKSEDYDYIAVAQHKDDETETLMINLIRGTGIAGFHGIYPKNNFIIRPLLFATRDEIEKFARKVKLPFREDSSNRELKYIRNKIRHQVIPILKEINPNLEETITQNIDKIREVEQIYKERIKEKRKEIVVEQDNKTLIPIKKLKSLESAKSYLYEFLRDYGYTSSVVDDIIASLDGIPGKQFFSATHRLVKDRNELIISKNKNAEDVDIEIKQGQTIINYPITLHIKEIANDDNFEISKDKNIACLDQGKLQFPLKLRRWKKGDVLYPLGMDKRKKLSDFFIDNKIPITEKENIFVLESGGKIVWIAGHRIDDRFKITKETEMVYLMELLYC